MGAPLVLGNPAGLGQTAAGNQRSTALSESARPSATRPYIVNPAGYTNGSESAFVSVLPLYD